MGKERIAALADKIADRLINLGGADYGKEKDISKEDIGNCLIARDMGIEEWDWPQGVGLYGLVKLQDYYGDRRYVSFLDNWFKRNIALGLPSKNVNTTMPFLALLETAELTGNKEYEAMCLDRAEWVMNSMTRTQGGAIQHVTSAVGDRNGVNLNPGNVWADTLFMTVLFLNKAGQRFKRQDYVDEAVYQFLMHIRYLSEKTNGLFHHGWTFEEMSNFGGVYWCRGNSWFSYGAVDFLSSFTSIPASGPDRRFITQVWKDQMYALVPLQAEDGLWHTVLDDEESYTESSGSAAIAAGMIKGLKDGLLPDSFRKVADKAIDGLLREVQEDGTVGSVSAGTPVAYSKEAYKAVPIAPMAYGQALALIALTEALGL